MHQDSFIVVRYGELSTKGKNRSSFVKQLKKNIQLSLKGFEQVVVSSNYNRILIELNGHESEPILNIVKKIYGISSLSLGVKTKKDLESISEVALDIMREKEGTFKVDTKRRDKNFGTSSDHINRTVAGHLLRNTELKVNVKQPDTLIKIEIEEKDEAYILALTIKGAGGYPVGVQGKGLLLLSGGIDSPVAATLANKRGMHLEAIHFESSPYTSVNALNKVLDIAQTLSMAQGYIKVHMIHFTEIQMAIYAAVNESYAITLMRRFMVRIAQEIAKRNHCEALVTGESLGQVASQTLQSLSVIENAIDMLVLRPLIAMDKNEIIQISKELGTYETSILPFEDCCTVFTPVAPVIKPKLDKVEHYEAKLDIEALVQKAIETAEVKFITPTQKEEVDLF